MDFLSGGKDADLLSAVDRRAIDSKSEHGIVVYLLTKHGKVIFLECASDFVKLLTDMLDKPMAAVIGDIDRSTRSKYLLSEKLDLNAMLDDVLSSSCGHLQELTPSIDSTGQASREDCLNPPICSNVTVSGNGPYSLTSHTSNFSAMAIFSNFEGEVLDLTIKFPTASDIMIGFAPKQTVLSLLGTPAIFMRCGFYMYCENGRLTLYGQDGTIHKPACVRVPSIALKLRLISGTRPVMRCAIDHGEFVGLNFETRIPGQLAYCPVVTFGKANEVCDISQISARAATSAEIRPVLEKEMLVSPPQTFLITNGLKILESSSQQALELMKSLKLKREELHMSSVVATPRQITRMLLRALLGHEDPLHFAFSDPREEKNFVSAQGQQAPIPQIVPVKASQVAAISTPQLGDGKKLATQVVAKQQEDEIHASAAQPKKKAISKSELLIVVDNLLANQTAMDKTTAKCWKDFAEYDDVEGRPALDLEHAEQMNVALTKEFGLPKAFFADLEELFTRFDFNGNRLLDKKECVKMYRFATVQKRRLIGGRSENVEITIASLIDKGYTMVRKLGEGGQGSMHLATREGSTKKYCIKCYDKAVDESTGGIDAIIDEFLLMEELEHINVCRTYEMFQSDSHYYLVNEPYFGGDLTKLYGKISEKGVKTNEVWWRHIFRQILSGLEYLHSQAIVHCDIKEPNVMIALDDSFKDPRPVLIDLGLAQFFADSQDSGGCGTTGYIPPEVWERGFWSPRGDIFSLGIVFFQLLANRIPSVPDDETVGILQVGDIDDFAAMEALTRAPLPWNEFPKNLLELKQLIEWMTCPEELKRPRVPQCSEHKWFNCGSNADWKLSKGNTVLSWFA